MSGTTSSKLASSHHVTRRRSLSPQRPPRRRHRRLSNITPHACKECRRKRTKCDGQTPCERCQKQQIQCTYEQVENPSKASLRAEIRSLRQTIAALAPSGDPEAGSKQTKLRPSIENANSTDSGLSLGDDKPNIAKEASSKQPEGHDGTVPVEANLSAHHDSPTLAADTLSLLSNTESYQAAKMRFSAGISQNEQPILHGPSGLLANAGLNNKDWALPLRISLSLTSDTWTSVTNDMESTRHLIALYFSWEYPNLAPISKEHFLRDFFAKRECFCSSLLVNAMLSLGCQLSDRSYETVTGPIGMSGDAFFAEACRLIPIESKQNFVTTVQALTIMSLREARSGRIVEGRYYAEQAMLLAAENNLHGAFDELHPDRDALSKAFWGAFMVNHTWSLTTGVLPQCTRFLQLPPKPEISVSLEQSTWAPYINGDAKLEAQIQHSNVRSVYECMCRLVELVHHALYDMHTPKQVPTGSTLLLIYQECLHWYDTLPQLMTQGQNSTPSVIFIHLYYHVFMLLLFRRFTRLRIQGSQISTRNTCVQSARAILTLVDSYSSLYTLRRTPAFLPYFLFAATWVYFDSCQDLDARDAEPMEQDLMMMRQSIEALEQMAPYHKISKQAMNLLYELARKRNISLHLDGIKAPFRDGSPDREPKDSDYSSGQPGNETASGIAVRPVGKDGMSIFGLVWLQDELFTGSRDQIEQAGFSFI